MWGGGGQTIALQPETLANSLVRVNEKDVQRMNARAIARQDIEGTV